ncbi:disease resistance protein RGA2-like isoform X2 [Miscanthus floridulus]|uniref:disease resistance protein RGA2-like isoform X2 n=1 Tax=Miscanthus floridulus TaxID=154761 RepID=UPI00345910FB
MELAVSAASWAVGKALAPVTGGLLEAWAASEGLGPNVDALKVELLYAQAMLENTRGREIRSPSLKELLSKLRQLAYDADDVLDELEYFRIQDELDGTYHAADVHAGGCVHGLALNARHTARAVAAKLNLCSGGSAGDVILAGDPAQQDKNAKQGCLSASVCSCGGRQTVSSLPPSPTNQDDGQEAAPACGIRNGRQFLGAVLPPKVQRCFSGVCLCRKRETSSSPPAPSNQCKKKVGGGCVCLLKVTSTARSAAQVVGKCFPCCSFPSDSDDNTHPGMLEKTNMPEDQRRFLCWTSKVQKGKNTALPPELKFNRVNISTKMKDIIDHLKPICAKVSNILNLEFMGTNRITEKDIAKKRPITTPETTEPQLYGREQQKKIILDIAHGNSSADNELVVLPIVGPGGIGKTTFTQHVYEELKNNPFEVAIWICVSLNFNAGRLAQEAVKKVPKVVNEKENSSVEELIEQRLKAKRFLLVLDDMWACHEDEWKKLLAPFRRGGGKGSMVIVTTRIREVAKMVIKTVHCPVIEMERLEGEDFMHFFEACIFGGQQPWEGHTDLREVGENIVSKLKGFPLAAKTVGRLLRSQLTLEHWTKVLESKEWELQTNDDDIMPALKLSYDYLPFHLQQCFYYCGLFPEDYEFDSKELVHLWIGLDIVQPCDLTRRIEDVGLNYINDLVNHGFLKKNERKDGSPYYVVHDLLHNLAVNISSFECLSICSSNVKSIQIRQDVRHLSIMVDNKDVEDINTFKYYKDDLSVLDKRLNVENLRTLMVFGEHSGSFANTFCDLFEKARALRAIYLFGASSYAMKDMLNKLPKHIHLRYLRIKSTDGTEDDTEDRDFNLSALTRLYHLEVIDMQEFKGHCGFTFTRHMSNLPKLRHFLVPQDKLQLHSNIVEVGKLKLLQELRWFEVGETKGFELSQLGQLSELGGSLSISSLERIRAMEDVHEARLIQIKHLHKLTLEWDANRPKKDTIHEENVLEILIPPSALKGLCIRGHGGTKCPQWLGENLSVKKLESLHLDGVAWNIFPPIGEFSLVNEPCEEISNNNICHDKFQNLKRLELVMLPSLRSWIVKAPCHLFAQLEVLAIRDCRELTELSFSHYACCQQQKEAKINWFPRLWELNIEDCPKLLSFPPVPWTTAPCPVRIKGVGSGLKKLVCEEDYKSEYSLEIKMKGALVSELWNMLAFDNLTELKKLEMDTCPPLPLHHFQMLSSLKSLGLYGASSSVFPLVEGVRHAEYHSPAECIDISQWDASAKELTQLLTYFPNLSELNMWSCEKITGLAVVEKQATETPALVSSDNKVDDDVEIEQQEGTRGEEEIDASSAEGLLLLPSQLQKLWIYNSPELNLCSCSGPADYKYNKEAGRTSTGRGLQGLRSLRSLEIIDCPRFNHIGMWGFKSRGTAASPRPRLPHRIKNPRNPQFLRWSRAPAAP